MALEKQTVRVPFGGGVDTKTDPKLVVNGKLLRLENGVFHTTGAVRKRNGFDTPFGDGTYDEKLIDIGYDVHARGKELLVTARKVSTVSGQIDLEDGNHVFSYDADNDIWQTIGVREPLSLSVETVCRSTDLWMIPDVAVTEDRKYACYAWINNDDPAEAGTHRYAHITVSNLTDDVTIIDNHQFSGIDVIYGVHVTGLYDQFAVWIASSIAGHIYAYTMDSGTLPTISGAYDLINDFQDDVVAHSMWDVCTTPYVGTMCSVVAYYDTSNTITIKWYGPSIGAGPVLLNTATLINDTPKNVICCFSAYDHITNTTKLVVAWQDGSGGASDGFIRAAVFNEDGSQYAAPHDVYAADAGDVRNLTGCKDTAMDYSTWPARSYLRYYAEVGDSQTPCDNIVMQFRCQFDGTNALELNTMQHCCLASKAWEYESKARVWVVHDSFGHNIGIAPNQYDHKELQNTYFLRSTQGNYEVLIKGQDRTDARCLAGAAHGCSGKHGIEWARSLSAVVPITSDKYLFAALRKDHIYNEDLRATQDSVVGIYTQFGELAQPSVTMGLTTQTGGGFVGDADGRFQELGFHLYPEAVYLFVSHAGSSGTAVKRFYRVTYEWLDREGQIHRSAPSEPLSIDCANDDDEVTIMVPNLSQGDYDRLNNVKIVVYRAEYNAALASLGRYYRMPEDAQRKNDPDTSYTAIVDVPYAAAVLQANELLYTEGGELDNICPPATSIMAIREDRVLLVPDEDKTNIWYAKLKQDGVGVSFSDLLTKRVSDGGDIVALGDMDGRQLVFKETQIRAYSGTGPNNLGEFGEFGTDFLVTGEVGCVDRASLVEMSKGMMFKSHRGIYILGHDFQVAYIGAPVEAYNDYKVLKATLVETKHQVRFLLEGSQMLVYDYLVNQWSVFKSPDAGGETTLWDAVDSAMWQNTYVMLKDDSTVYVETDAFTDEGAFIPLLVDVAWIKLNGLQGYQRVRWASFLGDVYGQCLINLDVFYDYVETIAQSFTFTVDNSIVVSPPPQLRMRPRMQKCEAIRFRLQDAAQPGWGGSQEGFSMTDIQLEIGVKKSVMRQGVAKTL